MRVLVCGGRAFKDRAMLWAALNGMAEISLIITGAQRLWNADIRRFVGADWLAIEWAMDTETPFVGHPAPWNKVGHKGAGPIRNAAMLELWKPEMVAAFPGSAGTRDMCDKAERAGIPVIKFS